MKKRLLTCLLIVTMLLSVPAAAFASGSAATTALSAGRTSVFAGLNDLATKITLRALFGSNAFYNNQWQTVKTVSKLNDNLYLMDYRYDYDIDDLLERGTDSIPDLLCYCSGHLFNGRINCSLNTEGFACSAFTCQNEEGDYLMGRNFDYKDAPTLAVWTDPTDGYASVSFVDTNMLLCGDLNKPRASAATLQLLLAPYVPMDGINEAGLSIGILQVKADAAKQDTGKTDIVNTVAIRAALDKCASVAEVVALFSAFDMHDMISSLSFHYCVSDATGDAAILEYINGELKVLREGVSAETDALAVTNYFLHPDGVTESAEGVQRRAFLADTLNGQKGVLTETEAMKLLNRVHLDYPVKLNLYQITTLYSAVYNNTDVTVDLCVRMNYKTIYRFKPGAAKQVWRVDADASVTDWTPWDS